MEILKKETAMFIRMTDHKWQKEMAGRNIPVTKELIGEWRWPIWNGRSLVNEIMETPATMGGQSTSGTPDITWGCQQLMLLCQANRCMTWLRECWRIHRWLQVSGVPADKQAKVTFFPAGSVSPPGFSPSPPTILVQVDGSQQSYLQNLQSIQTLPQHMPQGSFALGDSPHNFNMVPGAMGTEQPTELGAKQAVQEGNGETTGMLQAAPGEESMTLEQNDAGVAKEGNNDPGASGGAVVSEARTVGDANDPNPVVPGKNPIEVKQGLGTGQNEEVEKTGKPRLATVQEEGPIRSETVKFERYKIPGDINELGSWCKMIKEGWFAFEVERNGLIRDIYYLTDDMAPDSENAALGPYVEFGPHLSKKSIGPLFGFNARSIMGAVAILRLQAMKYMSSHQGLEYKGSPAVVGKELNDRITHASTELSKKGNSVDQIHKNMYVELQVPEVHFKNGKENVDHLMDWFIYRVYADILRNNSEVLDSIYRILGYDLCGASPKSEVALIIEQNWDRMGANITKKDIYNITDPIKEGGWNLLGEGVLRAIREVKNKTEYTTLYVGDCGVQPMSGLFREHTEGERCALVCLKEANPIFVVTVAEALTHSRVKRIIIHFGTNEWTKVLGIKEEMKKEDDYAYMKATRLLPKIFKKNPNLKSIVVTSKAAVSVTIFGGHNVVFIFQNTHEFDLSMV